MLYGQRRRHRLFEPETGAGGVGRVEVGVAEGGANRGLLLGPVRAEGPRRAAQPYAGGLRGAEELGRRLGVAAERAPDGDRVERLADPRVVAVVHPRAERDDEVLVGGDEVTAGQGDQAEDHVDGATAPLDRATLLERPGGGQQAGGRVERAPAPEHLRP